MSALDKKRPIPITTPDEQFWSVGYGPAENHWVAGWEPTRFDSLEDAQAWCDGWNEEYEHAQT